MLLPKEEFVNQCGLYNAHPKDREPGFGENSPLYTVTYMLICKINGNMEEYERIKKVLRKFYEDCKVRTGLYNQKPWIEGTKEDYMSHDQLTALIIFSLEGRFNWHWDIWQEIKRQKYRYNNVDSTDTFWQRLKNTRFVHPRDFLFYGYLVEDRGSMWFKIMKWLMLETFHRTYKIRPTLEKRIWYKLTHFGKQHPEYVEMFGTDGELLTWLKCQGSMSFPRIDELFGEASLLLIENDAFKGWQKVFTTYYHESHPTRIEALKQYK